MVKKMASRTPLGPVVRQWRAVRRIESWSPRDDAALVFYLQFIRPHDTVFDVGANLGNRTKIFAKLATQVVAIEPQTHCISVLRAGLGKNRKVRLVQAACGASEGTATLRISGGSTLSSLSDSWISAVTKSGRFDADQWVDTESCRVTTLDALLVEFGVPSFVKIDVEGFELDVLKGLSRPVRGLSLEFTPELIDQAASCLERLSSLGFDEFNFSPGESFELQYDPWLAKDAILNYLQGYRNDAVTFGDIYARLSSASGTPSIRLNE